MRGILSASLVATVLATSAPVEAAPPGSWTTFGHDFRRTGHADGAGVMQAPPKVAWTLPMGGTLGNQQAFVADINGDGRPETVTVTGGRVVAEEYSGSSLWSSALVGPSAILGAWDLDGSGSTEVVVDATAGVLVLAGDTGDVITTLPTSVSVSATFVQESKGGILVVTAAYGPVVAYDFRNGTSVSSPLWTIASAGFQPAELAGDVDGDGVPELVRSLNSGFEVDDPLTGIAKYSLPSMGPTAYYYDYELANVDGSPGDEIVAVDISYLYSPPCGIYVVGVQGGTLQTLWSSAESPSQALDANFFTVTDSIADLDGSGSLEIVYSQWDGAASIWTTVIADATTGTALGSIPDAFLQAVADLDGDGKAEVVTRSGVSANQSPPRSTITAYDFDSIQVGPVAKAWSLSASHIMTSISMQSPDSTGIPVPIVAAFGMPALDSSLTGLQLLVGADESMANADTNLLVIDGANGTTVSNYAVPSTVDPSIVALANDVTAATSSNDLVVAEDDGSVHLLDAALVDHVDFTAGSYANWLRGIANPSGYANLYMATSNNHMRWLDGRHLHADGTPYVRFDEPGVVSTLGLASEGYPADPVALLNGQTPTIVTFEQASDNVNVVAHGLSGVDSWSVALDPGSQVSVPGVYALDLNGDGNDDVLLNIIDVNSVPSLNAYDGTNGTLLSSLPVASLYSGADSLLSGSLVDVNGDGLLDVVAPVHSAPGTSVVAIDVFAQPYAKIWQTTQGSTPDCENGTVGAGPVVDGGTAGIFRSNGNNGLGPYELVGLDGGIVAFGSQGLPENVLGDDQNAVVMVAGVTVGTTDVIAAGSADVGLSRVRRINGTTMVTEWTMYAASGAVAPIAPTQVYALRDPVALDVNGDGIDDVVFGSDDGYLYALSSVDGSLLFAVNLGTPVTHVIAANIDLDPALELVASLSDGRLVAIDDNYVAVEDAPDGGAGDSGLDGAVDASADGAVDASADASIEAGGKDSGLEGGIDAGTESGEAAGGGCGCSEAGSPASTAAGLLALLAIAAIPVARRRVGRQGARTLKDSLISEPFLAA
jgi:MYXO-CTERM domain-containing protein